MLGSWEGWGTANRREVGKEASLLWEEGVATATVSTTDPVFRQDSDPHVDTREPFPDGLN